MTRAQRKQHAKGPVDTRLTAHDRFAVGNWPLWLVIGILRALVALPFSWQMRIGAGLGRLMYYALPGRRAIALNNIRIAMPDLGPRARRRLARRHFESLGISVLETGITWWRDPAWFMPRLRVEGREHLEEALKQGHGALLVTPHHTALEIAGICAARELNLCATYDPPYNLLVHKLLLGGRQRHIERVIHQSHLRGMLRTLRENRAMFFAPDLNMRRSRGAVFAPFFGVPVLTTTGTSRLARLSGAPVLIMLLLRNPGRDGYTVRFLPPISDFPTDDVEADTARVNRILEEQILANHPEQYFWVHQRFKRVPKGMQLPFTQVPERPPLSYRALSVALAPVWALYTRYRARKDGHRRYRLQRYAAGLKKLPRQAIWIHCASVGEVKAAIPLLDAMVDTGWGPLLVTTNTPTGYKQARKNVPDGTGVAYLPVDRPGPVRRFVRRLRPRAALIMETELWPWLYFELDYAAVPIFIINGRLSKRTRHAPRWFRPSQRYCLARVHRVFARSADDAEAFREMGARKRRIHVVGNLKFAGGKAVDPAAIDLPRPHVVAASTHADEEIRLARAWQAQGNPDYLLVIVPRHPDRGDDIARALVGQGIQVRQRSRDNPVDAETEVYLADTLGELVALMAGAQVVFMGGSLVPHGGQNVLEPARLERPIVTGPHMDNFREEMERLEAANAIMRVEDEHEAVRTINALLASPAERRRMGAAAREILIGESDIVERYMARLRNDLRYVLTGGDPR